MAFITWGDELDVGVETINAQHQKLVAMVNELHRAMIEKHGNAQLAKTFADLVDYTRVHFGYEERLFTRYAYPSAAPHQAEHQKLIAEASELRDRFSSGELMVSIKVLEFLKDWVSNHIKVTDKAYEEFFHKAGVR